MTARHLFPAALGFALGLLLAGAPGCSPAPTAGCGPDTCAGCCSNGKCVTSPNNAKVASCGQNGVECANCGTRACTEFRCEGAGGGSGGACGPATCGGGCCTGTSATSTCISPGTATNCGTSGSVCKSCGSGQACVAGDCKTVDGGANQVGTPCTDNSQCTALGAGSVCKLKTSSQMNDYVGGYCTKTCVDDLDCPGKSLCLGPQPGYGEKDSLCWAQCTTAQECRTGYDCYPIGSGLSACWISPLPPYDPGPPADKVGQPCGADATCKNPPDDGVCLTDRLADGGVSAFTDGYCSAQCDDTAHCSADGGAICISLGSFGACAQSCTGPQQGQGSCRQGYVCRAVRAGPDAGFLPVGFCWPSCKAAGCAAGTTCQATGYCG